MAHNSADRTGSMALAYAPGEGFRLLPLTVVKERKSVQRSHGERVSKVIRECQTLFNNQPSRELTE